MYMYIYICIYIYRLRAQALEQTAELFTASKRKNMPFVPAPPHWPLRSTLRLRRGWLSKPPARIIPPPSPPLPSPRFLLSHTVPALLLLLCTFFCKTFASILKDKMTVDSRRFCGIGWGGGGRGGRAFCFS